MEFFWLGKLDAHALLTISLQLIHQQICVLIWKSVIQCTPTLSHADGQSLPCSGDFVCFKCHCLHYFFSKFHFKTVHNRMFTNLLTKAVRWDLSVDICSNACLPATFRLKFPVKISPSLEQNVSLNSTAGTANGTFSPCTLCLCGSISS